MLQKFGLILHTILKKKHRKWKIENVVLPENSQSLGSLEI